MEAGALSSSRATPVHNVFFATELSAVPRTTRSSGGGTSEDNARLLTSVPRLSSSTTACNDAQRGGDSCPILLLCGTKIVLTPRARRHPDRLHGDYKLSRTPPP